MMTYISWPTLLVSVASSGATAWAVVAALSRHLGERWLANHKGELDKEFEAYRDTLEQRRKRVEAELGQRTYVSKTQFDTEFNAIKECFAKLSTLRLHINTLRPFRDRLLVDDNEEKRNAISSRLVPAVPAYNDFVDATDGFFPFIAEDIYNALHECAVAARTEMDNILDAGVKNAFSPEGYAAAGKNQDRLYVAYLKAAKLTRLRFARLAIASEG
jgi:isoleucyl-tRNA synthetase